MNKSWVRVDRRKALLVSAFLLSAVLCLAVLVWCRMLPDGMAVQEDRLRTDKVGIVATNAGPRVEKTDAGSMHLRDPAGLDPSTRTLLVTGSEGEPLEGVSIMRVILGARASRPLVVAQTDEAGMANVLPDNSGKCHLVASLHGYQSQVIPELSPSSLNHIRLMTGGVVMIRSVDESSLPLGGVIVGMSQVSVDSSELEGCSDSLGVGAASIRCVRTSELGVATLDGIPSGRYYVAAWHNDCVATKLSSYEIVVERGSSSSLEVVMVPVVIASVEAPGDDILACQWLDVVPRKASPHLRIRLHEIERSFLVRHPKAKVVARLSSRQLPPEAPLRWLGRRSGIKTASVPWKRLAEAVPTRMDTDPDGTVQWGRVKCVSTTGDETGILGADWLIASMVGGDMKGHLVSLPARGVCDIPVGSYQIVDGIVGDVNPRARSFTVMPYDGNNEYEVVCDLVMPWKVVTLAVTIDGVDYAGPVTLNAGLPGAKPTLSLNFPTCRSLSVPVPAAGGAYLEVHVAGCRPGRLVVGLLDSLRVDLRSGT